ncbi:DUF2272 domain-containing protein [Acetobacteraceae bacterium H6797]|nr:DUF2272 domain-containing protein [Acetobacteraceae bacterium H6797]
MGLALTVLSACAGPPKPPAITAASDTRGRIVQVALTEWERWGRLTVDGWPEALPHEAAPENYENILTYWESVPEGGAIAARHRQAHDALIASLAYQSEDGSDGQAYGTQPAAPIALPSISLWAYPAWSAAFVSYVMGRAGVPDTAFPPSAAHAFYIDSLLYAASYDHATAPFLPHDPQDYAPRPGDLICANRANTTRLAGWRDRMAETGQFRPLHCDVVVANGGGVVQAIGGNVLDAVVLRRFPADRSGRVLPAPLDKPSFFVVFQNRLN